MPTELSDSLNDEVLFPDDLVGRNFAVDELLIYSPEEVRDDLEGDPDHPQYGSWLPVVDGTGRRRFIAAPEELRRGLLDHDVEEGDTFRVTRCEQPENGEESAPYETNMTTDLEQF